jgi:hypothetical protein
MCRFATARLVTDWSCNRLWFRHSRRPSASCRGFVRSVEQVKPERPSLSAMRCTGVETSGTLAQRYCTYESVGSESVAAGQMHNIVRPSQLYCRDEAGAKGKTSGVRESPLRPPECCGDPRWAL